MGKDINIKVPTAVVQAKAVIGRNKIQPKKITKTEDSLAPKKRK